MEETLEEASERIKQESFMCCSISKSINYVTVGEREKYAFIKGAKWQQERSYSEEEVNQIIKLARQIKDNKDLFDLNDILGFTEICTHNWELLSEKEILEQFKKK